tara:strand:+ start:3294 stop:3575 length:282 start_codon:yes stop_codon:yes gene_type:complete
MPRKAGCENLTHYHYLIKKYNNNDKENLLESRYITTQKELIEKYGLNRSAIYYLLNPVEGRIKRKFGNIELMKVLEPIYNRVEILNNGLIKST